MKRSTISGMLLLLVNFLIAQSENQGNLQELKKIPIAPSPNASAIGKFGEIPVSMSTGIPSISIPFYSFSDNQKGLSLDVSISYHAGGHKVEDMPSNVGLGWALNAGGVISRTMRGRPDDEWGGYLNTDPLPYQYTDYSQGYYWPSSSTPISDGICIQNSSDFYVVKDVAENQIDGECDLFQFSIAGVSGKFFFKKNGEIQLFSQSNVKITYTRPSNGHITEFVVTDGKGIRYVFNQIEWNDAVNAIDNTPPVMTPYISSWYISKIISADSQDEIIFNYTSSPDIYYEGNFSDTYKSTLWPSGGGLIYKWTVQNYSFNYIHTLGAKRISSINLPDGTQLLFDYNFSRLDYTGDKALTEIKIKNEKREKKFILSYDYFISPTCSYGSPCTPPIQYSPNDYYKRLKLVSVNESDGVINLLPYTFEYNSTPLPNRNSKAQDWWGYYNGVGANSTLTYTIPAAGYPGGIVLSGDRTPSVEYTKAWVIEKINYPTGGYTRFEFEGNDGFQETTYRTIGGLRVKKTEDYDGVNNTLSTTNFTYKKTDNTSSGTLQTLPNYTYYWTYLFHQPETLQTSWWEYFLNETSNPSQSLSYINGSPVIYTRVKMDKDVAGQSNGYSIHEFTSFPSQHSPDDNFPFVQKQDLEWSQGLPTKETYYNSNNEIVKFVENEYDFFNYAPLSTDQQSRNLIAGLRHWDNMGTPSQNMYGARAYYLTYGRSELKKTTEKIYGQSGSVLETITERFYDNQYFVLTKTKTKTGKGDNIETRMYYPFNYNTTGLSNKTALINANRINELVSTETWQDNSGTSYLKNARVSDFAVFNSMVKESKVIAVETAGMLSLSTVGAFNPDNLKRHSSFKDQVLITAYDTKGRFIDMTNTGQLNSAIIWGKSNNYPICSAKNASSSEIAYTSFELDGNSSWQNINQSSIVDAKGVTGEKYYQQTSFNISKSTLNSGTVYKITYWSKNGSYAVSGNQSGWPKTLRTITIDGQTWTCYEHEATGQSTISISGTGSIDELRLYPKNAVMTTISYNPLLGITTQCDHNNQLVFYEYDGFFRLYQVKDQDGNILKKICYNYYGMIENCSGISSNPVWEPTGEVRCKACFSGSSYISDIQERLERDVNPSSATYNTYRWVDNGKSTSCVPQAVWQTISTTCELANGQNTGNQIVVSKDINPCSPTFNQTTTSIVQNQSACPPPGCNSSNCNGPDKKCVNGNCETGIKVYTSSEYNFQTGMYDCTYHYEWSDNSWSQDYVEQSGGECVIW